MNTADAVRFAGVVLTFTLLVVTHVAIVFGLFGRAPRWRALVALVVPPLAPYWGFQQRMTKRSVVWLAAAVLYVAALMAAR